MARARVSVGAAAGLSLLAVACVAARGGWDPTALDARYPELARLGAHRLADSPPYFAPAVGGLALFLCRWPRTRAIPVALPSDAPLADREVLAAALAAWQRAQLGISFATGALDESGRGIEIEFIELAGGDEQPATGDTIVDCRIPDGEGLQPMQEPLAAELHYASIHLHRSRLDQLGRAIPLEPAELLGAAVHELGHALGYPGHVALGDSVMSAHGQADAARRWGRRLRAGARLEEPALRALYAVPSGIPVGWLPLPDHALDTLRVLYPLARASGFSGPYTRVGTKSARLLWRSETGGSVTVGIPRWVDVLEDPNRFGVRLNVRARLLLRDAVAE